MPIVARYRTFVRRDDPRAGDGAARVELISYDDICIGLHGAGFICWLGEDGMFDHALFQLGMGSVLLNASQKEETPAARALGPCAEVICGGFGDVRLRAALFAAVEMPRAKKTRGNSAKALIPHAGPTGIAFQS